MKTLTAPPRVAPSPNGVPTHTRFVSMTLSSLSVDPRYQVPLSQSRVDKIKRDFDPFLCAPITISRRSLGVNVILDGQHRWCVLVDLGFQNVDCEVFDNLTLAQEAHIFAERNRQRRTPHPLQIFNARVEAGTEPYVSVSAIAHGAGYTIPRVASRGARLLTCPGDLGTVHSWGNLKATLFVLRETWPDRAEATLGDVVMGVAAFLKNWPEVDPNELVRKLEQRHLNAHGIVSLYTDALSQYRHSRDRRLWVHFARVLREAYDAQRRSGRLPNREIGIKARGKWRVRITEEPQDG